MLINEQFRCEISNIKIRNSHRKSKFRMSKFEFRMSKFKFQTSKFIFRRLFRACAGVRTRVRATSGKWFMRHDMYVWPLGTHLAPRIGQRKHTHTHMHSRCSWGKARPNRYITKNGGRYLSRGGACIGL